MHPWPCAHAQATWIVQSTRAPEYACYTTHLCGMMTVLRRCRFTSAILRKRPREFWRTLKYKRFRSTTRGRESISLWHHTLQHAHDE